MAGWVAANIAVGQSFFKVKRPKSHEMLIAFVDRIFGQGAWDEFIRMLRPELMFFAMGSGIVIANFGRGYATNQFPLPMFVNVFFASGAIVFLIAHFVRRFRERTAS